MPSILHNNLAGDPAIDGIAFYVERNIPVKSEYKISVGSELDWTCMYSCQSEQIAESEQHVSMCS